MLKNKIFIFITIILFVFTFFSGSVYATEDTGTTDTFSFTGVDNNTYTVPTLPEVDFEHYFIVNKGSDIHLYMFTGSFSVTKFSDTGAIFEFDTSSYFRYKLENNIWSKKSSTGTYSYSSFTVITSCTDLLSSIDKMNAVAFAEEGSEESSFFYNAPTVALDGTLAPIYQKTTLTGVLQEIVTILPIVLTIIVGLIGLRKALAFLSKVLHRS